MSTIFGKIINNFLDIYLFPPVFTEMIDKHWGDMIRLSGIRIVKIMRKTMMVMMVVMMMMMMMLTMMTMNMMMMIYI